MKRWKRLIWSAASSLAVILTHATALAQDIDPTAEPAPKKYVLQYSLILLLVGLGLMTVCRPGKRAEGTPKRD